MTRSSKCPGKEDEIRNDRESQKQGHRKPTEDQCTERQQQGEVFSKNIKIR